MLKNLRNFKSQSIENVTCVLGEPESVNQVQLSIKNDAEGCVYIFIKEKSFWYTNYMRVYLHSSLLYISSAHHSLSCMIRVQYTIIFLWFGNYEDNKVYSETLKSETRISLIAAYGRVISFLWSLLWRIFVCACIHIATDGSS